MEQKTTKFKINAILLISLLIIVFLSTLCIFLSVELYNKKKELNSQQEILRSYQSNDETAAADN